MVHQGCGAAQAPAVMVSDGPHGLRTQKEKKDDRYVGSVEAVCFPSGAALASSFDRGLLERVGDDLGTEASSEGCIRFLDLRSTSNAVRCVDGISSIIPRIPILPESWRYPT